MTTLRRITIGAEQYQWHIKPLDERHILLRVWGAHTPRHEPLGVRLRFDDPWANFGPIITAPPERRGELFQLRPATPALVRQVIEAALREGWQPSGPTRRFDWGEGGALLPLEE
ncbi:hypothetical protein F8S13_14665 [Chloroflexia bacterium SDU3-3]|nr:hypothetical protein F8S13_14665 [Chloroflexia bacterium SDU3-3]